MWTACFLLLLLGPAISHGAEYSLHEERDTSDSRENRSGDQIEELRPKRQFFSDFSTPDPASRRRFSPIVRRPSHRRSTFSSPIAESTTRVSRPRHEGPDVDLSSFEFRRTVPRNPILYTPSYRIKNSEESAQQLRSGSRPRNGHSESTTKRSVTNPVNQGVFHRQSSPSRSASLPSLKKVLHKTHTLEAASILPDSRTESTTTTPSDLIKLRRPSLRSSSTSAIPLTTMETVPALVKFLESSEDGNEVATVTAVSQPTPVTIDSSTFNRSPGFRLVSKAQTLSTSTITTASNGVESLKSTTAASTSFLPVTNRLTKFRRQFLKPVNKFQTLSTATTTVSPKGLYVPMTEDNDATVDVTSPATSVVPTTKYRRPFLKPLSKVQTYSVTSTTEAPIEVEVSLKPPSTEKFQSQVIKAGGDATTNSSVQSSSARFESEGNGIVKLRRPPLKPFRRVPIRTELPTTTTMEMTTFIPTTEAETSSIETYAEDDGKVQTTSQIDGSPEAPIGIRTSTPIKASNDFKKYKEINRKSKNGTRATDNKTVTESEISLTMESATNELGGETDNLNPTSPPKTPIMASILKKFTKFKLPLFGLSRKTAIISKDTTNANTNTITNGTYPEIAENPEHVSRKSTQERLPAFRLGKATTSSTKKDKDNQEYSTVHVEDETNEPFIKQFVVEEINKSNESSNYGKLNVTPETSTDESIVINKKESESNPILLTSKIPNGSDTLDGTESTNAPRSRTLFPNKKLKEAISTSITRNNGNSNVVRPASPYPVFGSKTRNRSLHILRNDPLGVKNDDLRKRDENESKAENRFFVSSTAIDEKMKNTSQVIDETVSLRKLAMPTNDPVVLKMILKPIVLSENSTLHVSEGIQYSEPIKGSSEISELQSDSLTPSPKLGVSTNQTYKSFYEPMLYDNGRDQRLRLQLRPRKDDKNKLPSKIVVTIQHVDSQRDTEGIKHSSVRRLDISKNGDLEYKTDNIIVTVQVAQFNENRVDPVCKACNNKTSFHLSFQDMMDNSSVIPDAQEQSTPTQTSVKDGVNQTRTKETSSSTKHPIQITTESIVHSAPSLDTFNSEKLEMVLNSDHTTSLPVFLTTAKENESTNEEEWLSTHGPIVITSDRPESSTEELFLPTAVIPSNENKSLREEFQSEEFPSHPPLKTSEENERSTEEFFPAQAITTEITPTSNTSNTESYVSKTQPFNTKHTTYTLSNRDKPVTNPFVTLNETEFSTTIPSTEVFSTHTVVPETSNYDDYTKGETTTEMVTTDQYTTINISDIFGIDNIKVNSDNDQVAMWKNSSEEILNTFQNDEVMPNHSSLFKDYLNDISQEISVTEVTIAEVEGNEKFTTNEYSTEDVEILETSVTPMTNGVEKLYTNSEDQQTTELGTFTKLPWSPESRKRILIPDLSPPSSAKFRAFQNERDFMDYGFVAENLGRTDSFRDLPTFLRLHEIEEKFRNKERLRSDNNNESDNSVDMSLSPTDFDIFMGEYNGSDEMSYVLNKGNSESSSSEPESPSLPSYIFNEVSPKDNVTGNSTDSTQFEIPELNEITTENGRTTLEQDDKVIEEVKRRVIIDGYGSTRPLESITEKYVVVVPEEISDTVLMKPNRIESSSRNVTVNSALPYEETVGSLVNLGDSKETGSEEKTTEETQSIVEDVITTTDVSNAFLRFVLGDDSDNMRSETEPRIGGGGGPNALSSELDEHKSDVLDAETTTETWESVTKPHESGNEYSTTVETVDSKIDSEEALESTASTLEPLGKLE